jgi:hypothetical protein
MTWHATSNKRFTNSLNGGAQRGCDILKPIDHVASRSGETAAAEIIDKFCEPPMRILCRVGSCGGGVELVEGRSGGNSLRRLHNHNMQAGNPIRGDNLLAPPAADGRSAGKKERHVTAHLGGKFDELRPAVVQAPRGVGQDHRGCGVGACSSHAGLHGDAFQ